MKNALYPYVYDLVLGYHYRWSFETAIDSMEIWKVKLKAGNEVPEYWLYQVDIRKKFQKDRFSFTGSETNLITLISVIGKIGIITEGMNSWNFGR